MSEQVVQYLVKIFSEIVGYTNSQAHEPCDVLNDFASVYQYNKSILSVSL
jgi:hypothetical protein